MFTEFNRWRRVACGLGALKGTEIPTLRPGTFNNYWMGIGGAIAVMLFSISLVFVGLYLWVSLKDELEY